MVNVIKLNEKLPAVRLVPSQVPLDSFRPL